MPSVNRSPSTTSASEPTSTQQKGHHTSISGASNDTSGTVAGNAVPVPALAVPNRGSGLDIFRRRISSAVSRKSSDDSSTGSDGDAQSMQSKKSFVRRVADAEVFVEGRHLRGYAGLNSTGSATDSDAVSVWSEKTSTSRGYPGLNAARKSVDIESGSECDARVVREVFVERKGVRGYPGLSRTFRAD